MADKVYVQFEDGCPPTLVVFNGIWLTHIKLAIEACRSRLSEATVAGILEQTKVRWSAGHGDKYIIVNEWRN